MPSGTVTLGPGADELTVKLVVPPGFLALAAVSPQSMDTSHTVLMGLAAVLVVASVSDPKSKEPPGFAVANCVGALGDPLWAGGVRVREFVAELDS